MPGDLNRRFGGAVKSARIKSGLSQEALGQSVTALWSAGYGERMCLTAGGSRLPLSHITRSILTSMAQSDGAAITTSQRLRGTAG